MLMRYTFEGSNGAWTVQYDQLGPVIALAKSLQQTHQSYRIFTADAEVIASGTNALRALSIALPFWALWFVSSGSLRGSVPRGKRTGPA